MIGELKKKLLGETRWRNPFANSKYGNLKCFCGSGVKLKKCHGVKTSLDKAELEAARELFHKWEESPAGLEFFRKKKEGK